MFAGERVPLVNPQRGIFKPRSMEHLLSIRTVFPRSGARVWYDDQRVVHEQVARGAELIDYAFMGSDPDAADNRWLRRARHDQVPVIYFLRRFMDVAPRRLDPKHGNAERSPHRQARNGSSENAVSICSCVSDCRPRNRSRGAGGQGAGLAVAICSRLVDLNQRGADREEQSRANSKIDL